MKHLTIFGIFLALGGNAYGAAGLPQPAEVKSVLNLGGAEGLRRVQLGTQLTDKKVQVLKAQYSYAVSGGASTAAISLLDVDGKDAVLPDNAVIKQVTADVLTEPTSVGVPAATLSVGIITPADLFAARSTVASWTGILAGVPVDTAATMVKNTAKSTVKGFIGASSLTAGKVNFFIEYYLSD